MVEKKRKGASKISAVPPDILKQLEAGSIESATLSEGLAIDFARLAGNLYPDLTATAQDKLDPKLGITKRMATASQLIVATKGYEVIEQLATHPSDTVRGWAAYAIANQPNVSLAQRIAQIQPFADDSHFGVREWAWLAIRPEVAKAPSEAIAILTPWALNPSEYVRRFACEAIRPRGVWSAHIAELKTDPSLALPILEPLRSDQSRYVQDSVGNWLNDAFKSQPEWVAETCNRWQGQSSTSETAYIVKRGLRSQKT